MSDGKVVVDWPKPAFDAHAVDEEQREAAKDNRADRIMREACEGESLSDDDMVRVALAFLDQATYQSPTGYQLGTGTYRDIKKLLGMPS